MPAEDQKRTYSSEAEVNAKLEPLRADIANGMSDDDVVRLTELPRRTIQRWRLKHGLKRPKGFEAKNAADVYTLSVLGEGLGDARHRTKRSVLDGRWEPPVFVVREHIDYDNFLRLLDTAHRVMGMTEHQLVAALGMSPKSIEQGLALYARQRADGSKTCLTCKEKMNTTDPALFCTALCERLHAQLK
jgi:hypothetical protein